MLRYHFVAQPVGSDTILSGNPTCLGQSGILRILSCVAYTKIIYFLLKIGLFFITQCVPRRRVCFSDHSCQQKQKHAQAPLDCCGSVAQRLALRSDWGEAHLSHRAQPFDESQQHHALERTNLSLCSSTSSIKYELMPFPPNA